MKHDINSEADVDFMIRSFYQIAVSDEDIGVFFKNIDWEAHFPRMIAFGSFVILDIDGYRENLLQKRMHLSIKKPHFDIWLKILKDNIDKHFSGEKAELAKQRAAVMSFTFKSKFPD